MTRLLFALLISFGFFMIGGNGYATSKSKKEKKKISKIPLFSKLKLPKTKSLKIYKTPIKKAGKGQAKDGKKTTASSARKRPPTRPPRQAKAIKITPPPVNPGSKVVKIKERKGADVKSEPKAKIRPIWTRLILYKEGMGRRRWRRLWKGHILIDSRGKLFYSCPSLSSCQEIKNDMKSISRTGVLYKGKKISSKSVHYPWALRRLLERSYNYRIETQQGDHRFLRGRR